MIVQLPTPDYCQTLTQAATAVRDGVGDRPRAAEVVAALLQAEKAAKRSRLTIPFGSLTGQWRLCFTTSTRKAQKRGGILLGKGFYLPQWVPAYIAVTESTAAPDRGEIRNQVQLGAMQLKFTGPCRYLGKKNLLAFDFTQMQLHGFGRQIFQKSIRGGNAQASPFEQQAIAQLPFFAFFLATDDLIAARGRGGGLAIWIREAAHAPLD